MKAALAAGLSEEADFLTACGSDAIMSNVTNLKCRRDIQNG